MIPASDMCCENKPKSSETVFYPSQAAGTGRRTVLETLQQPLQLNTDHSRVWVENSDFGLGSS